MQAFLKLKLGSVSNQCVKNVFKLSFFLKGINTRILQYYGMCLFGVCISND